MAAARQGSLTKESGSPGYISPVFVLADRQEGLPHDSVSCHLEGYPLKETAQYVTGGEVVKTFNAMAEKMFHGAATAKGALIITPEKVIVSPPGADNRKELSAQWAGAEMYTLINFIVTCPDGRTSL